jgi:hypothetical protein
MGYLKTLISKDVIVTPFTVHKQFSIEGATPPIPSYSETGSFSVEGINNSYPLSGGKISTGSAILVYNGIKQLYYSNYLKNTGNVSNVGTVSFNPDGTITGPSYTPNYINNIQSINDLRYFPTQSNKEIQVLSIPSKQFGEYIKPGSFSSLTTYDDGEGNIRANSSYGLNEGEVVGNILYNAGMVIHTGYTGSGGTLTFRDLQWESSYIIYETQYKCTIRANEFNYSLNPSLLSSSIKGQNKILESGSAQYADFVTGSDFSPYVTTIGLYNDNQELLAVAKLAQPLPTSQTTDTTILINLDR